MFKQLTHCVTEDSLKPILEVLEPKQSKDDLMEEDGEGSEAGDSGEVSEAGDSGEGSEAGDSGEAMWNAFSMQLPYSSSVFSLCPVPWSV